MLYNAGITTGEAGRGICYCYMLVCKVKPMKDLGCGVIPLKRSYNDCVTHERSGIDCFQWVISRSHINKQWYIYASLNKRLKI